MSQSQRAYEQLRDDTVAREMPPGVRLNQVPLAERLSLGRRPRGPERPKAPGCRRRDAVEKCYWATLFINIREER